MGDPAGQGPMARGCVPPRPAAGIRYTPLALRGATARPGRPW